MKNSEIAKEIAEKKALWSSARRAAPIQQIRRAMREKKVLNKDLSERLGVSEASISRLLSGSQNLQLDTLYMLADALDQQLVIAIEVQDEVREDVDEPVNISSCIDNKSIEATVDGNLFSGFCDSEITFKIGVSCNDSIIMRGEDFQAVNDNVYHLENYSRLRRSSKPVEVVASFAECTF